MVRVCVSVCMQRARCVCARVSHYIPFDECFSVEETEERGGQAAVYLPKMRPRLLAQMQPDKALAPRMRCRAQISVRELQEAVQAPPPPAGPSEGPPRDLRLRVAQLKRRPNPRIEIAAPSRPLTIAFLFILSIRTRSRARARVICQVIYSLDRRLRDVSVIL